MHNLKLKIILILSFLILSVASVIVFYNIYHDKGENERRLSEAYEHVSRTYHETIQDTIHFYHSRTEANLRSPGIIDAFRSGDHDKLYKLMRPRWEVMQRENPWLILMQFHKADGTSLLRLHQPEVYGDKIATQRSMVAYAHQNQQSISGFEEGRQGLAFRILVPAFHEGNYIGAVEFGIAPPYFIDKIRRFVGYDAFFFVHQNLLGKFGRIGKTVMIGEYRGIDIPVKSYPVIEKYASHYSKLQNGVVSLSNQTYEVNVLQVKDYRTRPIGAIMFVRSANDFHAHVRHMIIASGLIVIVLILIIGVIVDRVYSLVVAKMSFQERYAQTILDAVPSPVIVTDGARLIAANNSFLEYFHYENLDQFKLDHACVCEYFEEGDTDEYLMPMRNDKRWTEYMLDHPLITHKAKITLEGITTVFEVKISVLRVNEAARYVVMFNDISSMQIQTMTDALTGVANRLHFTMVYQHVINMARRGEKPLGIIMFDIDHFKNVNDKYGHLMGDMVLKRISSLVRQQIRKSDIIARWGGEEFVVLLPDTALEETIKVAQLLRKTIESENFETVGKVTCSFGASAFEGEETAEELLKRTDEKLYEAKESGRNKVVY